MATTIQVVFDCADPAAQAEFWTQALHYHLPDPPAPHATWEEFLRASGVPEEDFDSAGRWLEADYDVDGTIVTVVSAYVHSGEVGTPKQDEKWRFLDGMERRLPEIARHSELAVVVGDLNVGHRELDIRNWKGSVKKAGFLPRERAYSTASSAPPASRSPASTGLRARGSAGSTSGGSRTAMSTDRTRGGR